MTWEPLTRVFCAESFKDGIDFAHTFYAPDEKTAERIAKELGWRFCGELVEDNSFEETVAQIEMAVSRPVIH